MDAARTTRRSRRSGLAEERAQPAEGQSRRTGGGSGQTSPDDVYGVLAECSLEG
jgi:hypothetical protein